MIGGVPAYLHHGFWLSFRESCDRYVHCVGGDKDDDDAATYDCDANDVDEDVSGGADDVLSSASSESCEPLT
eukprot:8694303-Pyramimonas_sp.AAC.1